VALQIGLGRGTTQHQRVGVDIRQILALFGREAGYGHGVTRRADVIDQVALDPRGPLMNIRYRVELRQDERDPLTALLSGGKHPARKIKRAQILLAADAGIGDEAIGASVSGRRAN
jgi:hypothetical protein